MKNAAIPFALCFSLLLSVACFSQSNTGELQIQVQDAQGLALPSVAVLTSEANQVEETLPTDRTGKLDVRHLPFGHYSLIVRRDGFVSSSEAIDIESSIPKRSIVTLQLAPANSSVTVHPVPTLLDPSRAGTSYRIGKQQIENRAASLPGRGLVDLINTQPGWLYEGNAVLHPRGSEYQTQFVVNGIPLTENRSPGFGTQLEATDVQSMTIYTAGIPAEFGRKLGGVIEVNTVRNARPGLHGTAELSGGSFATSDGYLFSQYGWGQGEKNSVGVGANGAYTDWYENPPVVQNFTNNATSGDFSGQYQRRFSSSDRLTLVVRHDFARFRVPNEQVQEAAGQIQDRDVLESMGTASWQHLVSSHAMTTLSGMVRDDTTHLNSNDLSTPIIAGQDRGFREGYIKGTATLDRGNQEWKAGFEGDFINIHEGFQYTITDPSQFDPGTPKNFTFFQRGQDREEAVFVEDDAQFHHWNLAAGIRWDNYQLVVHQNAFSPRLALSHYFARENLIAHISYDRVFQTPAFENILLSSSPQVISLNPEVLRLPVEPSDGNYYEVGVTKGFLQRLRSDTNAYLRREANFADDNQLLDTAISFPIAFRKASVYGVEEKFEMAEWKKFSGYVSYSYMVASAYLPVTGGLFLGVDATQALQQRNGRLWVSQDQRNSIRARWMYRFPHGVWAAAGYQYGSGLPVEFAGTEQEAIAQYGQAIVDRVNFARGRVRPNATVSASLGVRIWKRNASILDLQASGDNLNDRLNLIDFAGLFSGNAVAPPRSYSLRLTLHY